MAAFDFPASPSEGQIFTPPGGPTYTFTGGRWVATGLITGGAVPEAANDGQAYVRQALGWVVGYTKAAIDALLALKAPLDSPVFTGNPQSSATLTPGSSNSSLATTAFVTAADNLKAPLASPVFTGHPKGVTESPGDNTTNLATTAFVRAAVTDAALFPAGEVSWFAMATPPTGWLECDGSLVSTVTYARLFTALGYLYGGSGSSFALPDLRGEFIRGWSHGHATVDVGRAMGSKQAGAIEAHQHPVNLTSANNNVDHTHQFSDTSTTGGESVDHQHAFSDTTSTTSTAGAHTHNIPTPSGAVGVMVAHTGGGGLVGSGTSHYTTSFTLATDVEAAHSHTVAVSGTTGGRTAGHTHQVTISGPTLGQSVAHTHAVAGNTGNNTTLAATDTRPRNVALLACIRF